MYRELKRNVRSLLRFDFLRNYLNEHPIQLRTIMNIFSAFNNHGNELKVKLLRFCGATIGNNVHIGDNIYMYNPKNLILDDYVGIADNTTMRCWNKIHI